MNFPWLPDFPCGSFGPSLERVGNWSGEGPRRSRWKGGAKEYTSWRIWSCLHRDTGNHGWKLRLEEKAFCSLQSVSTSFRWKTSIHRPGLWKHVSIHEPLLPWNQDANYMLSESIFLQQGLEACALASCSDSGSKNPPSPYWTQFIFSFFPSQQLITSSSAWVSDRKLKYLSSPIHALLHILLWPPTSLSPYPISQHSFLFQ